MVVSGFPRRSETFALSELVALDAAGALVAIFITFEAPFSGMSMNPARTLASAFSAGEFPSIWIYFTAPPLGMFFAAQLYRLRGGAPAVHCAKLNHHNHTRCIFRCRFAELEKGD